MVTLKGTADGLTITLSDGPWSKVLAELALELERPRAVELFRGAHVRVETGERGLTPLEAEELAWLLELHDMKFEWRASPVPVIPPAVTEIPPVPPPNGDFSFKLWEDAALAPRTVRSGQVLRYAGHIVVLGDVNPGAEVIAAGDVLVWGRLRGVVHAGASGEDNAVVCALMLSPGQLRIGKHIARAPDERGVSASGPEIARVRDGRIVIEAWNMSK